MNPDDIEHDAPDPDSYESEPPRSIFSALWFRAVLVVIVVGVVAALAVPYVLEWVSPPPPGATEARLDSAPASAASPMTAAAPTPDPSSSEKPAAESAAPPSASAPTATPLAPALKQETEKPAPRAAAPPMEKPAKPTMENPAKPAPIAKAAKPAPARRVAKAVAKPPATTAGGTFFVQVGAFKDEAHAGRVAMRLREAKFAVQESTTTTTGATGSAAPAPAPAASEPVADRYDVFVSGAAVADINAKLAAKGLATEPAAAGVVVKPPLPLRDAVALSKDLAAQGFKVQVRRAGGPAPAPAPQPAAAGGGATLHRVRVGPYADRAAAAAALDALREKGYKDSFIARGGA
jgi:cell division septation protein DedD